MDSLRKIDFNELESQAELSGNYSKVLEKIEPLVKLGHAEAQCYFASFYHLGLGVSPDALTAIKYYELSSEQGYALASHNLSSLYFTGVANFSAYPESGMHWHQVSISQGFPS
jgi:TPR repeat protein